MNYLELAQRLAREAGVSGAGPAAVTDQVGEMARLVAWVADAWTDIQTSQSRWRFLWVRGAKAVLAGSQVHNLSEFSGGVEAIDDARWRLYQTDLGTSDTQDLQYLPWDDFSAVYDRGLPVASARPTLFTIRPDKKLMFPSTLPADFTLACEYYRDSPQVLAANTDVPLAPAKYHMAIVWQALAYYADFEEAGGVLVRAERKLARLMTRMHITELPQARFGDPLA